MGTAVRRTVALASVATWVMATWMPGAASALDEYRASGDRIHWVLVTTDTHIGTSGDRPQENLAWVTREACQAVQPEWVVVTGDLTDASPGGLIPWGPQEGEWRDYRALVEASGMNASVYLDLPGNHDQYNDRGMPHFLQWSIQGAATGRTQQSVVMGDPDGGVHLLGLATPGNDGAVPPLDNAGLDAGELLFAQQALEDHGDAVAHVLFGHHPLDDLTYGRQEIEDLMRTWDVAAYLYGHTHKYEASFQGRTLLLNLDSLGKADHNHVALLALDGGILSVRAFDAGKWPMILVTVPADAALGGGNPRAPSLPPDWPQCPIRALVFGDQPAGEVTAQVDDREPVPLRPAGYGRFEGTLDTTGLSVGQHRLRVRAAPWNRGDHEIAFRVGATACRNGKDDDFDGLTDWPDDPGCESPLSEREDRVPPDPGDPGGGEDVGVADGGPETIAGEEVPGDSELVPEAADEAPGDGMPEAVAEEVPEAGALDTGESEEDRNPVARDAWENPETGALDAPDGPSEDTPAPARKGGGCAAPAGSPESCLPLLILLWGTVTASSRRTLRHRDGSRRETR
ncbi:MAG TPA: metallophosphoesterase [Myxococcota bacterium]|nr:metallophosphoesterase [Myxococcota bacterium]HQK51559.1 metallophosphoesterase [Myxococcota bacterium]